MRDLSFTTAAIGLGLVVGHVAFSSTASAQTCTGRSVAVDRSDPKIHVRDIPEYLADDVSDEPAYGYTRSPQRGRNGR